MTYKDFTLDLIMTEAGWVLPNVNPVDSLTKEQLRVYEVVAGAAGKFITTAEIARAVGKTEPATINILNRLITLGLIIRVKTGTYALAGATTSATGKGSSQEMQVNNQIGQGMPQ